MKSKDWKRTTPILKNMNCKILIPKLAIVAFALSASAVLSQEEILIITGKRADKTVFYQISPNARKLDFSDNRLTSLTLPEGLTNLEDLNLDGNQLTSFTLPSGLTNLEDLDLDNNLLTSLTLSEDLTSLKDLTLATNQLTSLTLPEGLTDSWELDISNNQLTSLTLPEALTDLGSLDLSGNQLTSFTLPAGLRLRELDLRNNPIEQLLVPEGRNIDNLELHGFSKEDIERYTPRGWDGWVVILFSGGVLQYTENLSSGEWKDLPDAFTPFRINPTVAAQRFFRILPFEPFYQKNVSVNLANQVISWNSIPGFEYRIEAKVRPEDHWREIGKVVADSRTTVWNFTQVAPGNYQIFRIASNSPIELSIEKEY